LITVTFYDIFIINQHCVDFNSGVGELHSPRLQPKKENRERVEIMEIIVGILKQKILWIGLAVVILFASVLTIALLGSTINAELKGAPMALVLQDEGVALQSGVELNFGQKIVDSVMTSIGGQDNSAFKWTILTDKNEAMDAMNDQKYYGALIIPKDFSKKVMSVTSANQTPGEVEVYINNGMSQTVANVLTQVMEKMETGINDKLRTQLAAQLASATKQTPEIGQSPSKQTSQTASAQAAAMQAQRQMMQSLQQNTLVSFTIDKVNVIPDHSANGNAPVSVTMLAWMTGLTSSILLFFVIKKVEPTKKRKRRLRLEYRSFVPLRFASLLRWLS
jgi:Predicted membrane protein